MINPIRLDTTQNFLDLKVTLEKALKESICLEIDIDDENFLIEVNGILFNRVTKLLKHSTGIIIYKGDLDVGFVSIKDKKLVINISDDNIYTDIVKINIVDI